MITLMFASGPLAGERVLVDRDLIIGRHPVDVQIVDAEVSRRHARIVAGDVPSIEDLGSLNGTYVNQRRIATPTPLEPGDVVVIGDSTIEIEGDVSRSAPTVIAATPSFAVSPAPTIVTTGDQPEPAVGSASEDVVVTPEEPPARPDQDQVPSAETPSFTHGGGRYLLGYTDDACGIWRVGSQAPERTFPRTADGWAQAWAAFVDLEPDGGPLS
jgi:hypothetical protein